MLHVRTKLLNNNEIFGAMDNASIFDSSIVKLIQWDIKLAVYRNNYIHIAMHLGCSQIVSHILHNSDVSSMGYACILKMYTSIKRKVVQSLLSYNFNHKKPEL